MARTQQQNALSGLFPPNFFDDPDTIAQIAGVENALPQAGAPSQPGGIVPKSFTEWASDPVNTGKVAPPVPDGTPTPNVAAQAVSKAASALPSPSDYPPPFSLDVQGSPESQLFGPTEEAPQAEGPGLTKGTQAATQPTAPAGPLSKADFLAQNPVKMPGAPYVPQGKKLALTGLFAALDNAGAYLDHGTPTVGPGLMRNVQALQEYNQNQPAAQAQAEENAYQNYLKDYGTARQNTLSLITAIGPDGRPFSYYGDPKAQQAQGVANTRAAATLGAAEIRAMAVQGQTTMKAAYMPDGSLGVGLYDKGGNFRGYADHAVVPAEYLDKIKHGQQFMLDGDGHLHALSTTTTTAPAIPPAPGGTAGGTATAPPHQRRTGTPPTRTGTPTANTAPGVTQPPKSTPGDHIVPGFHGKPAVEQGYAVNPQTNELELTSREDAAAKGMQNFRPVQAKQIGDDTRLNNQLGDVAQKVTRYSQAIDTIPEEDQNKIAYLLNSDKFKLGAFGAEIPVDEVNTFLKQHQLGALSKEGVNTFNSYLQAREALVGYNRVLSGSSRSNEKQLELLLQALPDPTQPKNVIRNGIDQFVENIHIAGNGLPRMAGVKSWHDYMPAGSTTPQGASAPGNKSGANFFTQFGGRAH